MRYDTIGYNRMRCDTMQYVEHKQVFIDRYAFEKFDIIVLPRYDPIHVITEELPNLNKTTSATDDALSFGSYRHCNILIRFLMTSSTNEQDRIDPELLNIRRVIIPCFTVRRMSEGKLVYKQVVARQTEQWLWHEH